MEEGDGETVAALLEEYNAWRKREFQRYIRDEEARRLREEEEMEKERRSKMTDRQVELENRERSEQGGNKPKKQMRFMQRYYHKGAFFQDLQETEEVLQRDFSVPTGEDADFDKANLPSVMQVRGFGRAKRSRYTHLADQDTSQPDAFGGALGAHKKRKR